MLFVNKKKGNETVLSFSLLAFNLYSFARNCIECLLALRFTPYQQFFSYLMATVHESMFSRLF